MNPVSGVIDARDFEHPEFRSTIDEIHDTIGAPHVYDDVVSGRGGAFVQGTKNWEYPWLVLSMRDKIRSGDKVLDAGGGRGALQVYLAKKFGVVVTVVDLIDLGLYFNDVYGISNEYVAGNLEKLSIVDNWFDSIFCVSVLEHTERPLEVLRELYRVLKPGGWLGLSVDWEGAAPFDSDNFSNLLASSGFLFSLQRVLEVPDFEALERCKFVKDCPPIYSVAALTLRKPE